MMCFVARWIAGLVAAAVISPGLTAGASTAELFASPARITLHSRAFRHFEYVFPDGAMYVYDIDHSNRLVEHIDLPGLNRARGAAASPRTHMLYVSFGGQGGATGTGSLLALDLQSQRVVWRHTYATGTDRIAITITITNDGRSIYMPVGEDSGSGVFEIIDARTGRVTGSIEAGAGPHDAVIGHDGRRVYLSGVDNPYLAVVSTATNRIVGEIGPLRSGGRPFAIDRAQSLAFTTAEGLLGFQVSEIATGKALFTVGVPGFPYDPATTIPCHGLALSPDERRLYLVDSAHGYVHVFDIAGLPAHAPRLVASIRLRHNPYQRAWLQMSSKGRFLYVGSSGDVIDTSKRTVVANLHALRTTGDSIEIAWRLGRPVGNV